MSTTRLVLILAIVVVGCGSPQPLSPVPPTAGPRVETPAPSLAPSQDPAAEGARYTCDTPPGFPLSVFDQPAVGELEVSPSAEALRRALTSDLPPGEFPRSGYWLVGRGPARADYVARSASGRSPFVYASFDVQAGSWTLSGYGECRPARVLDGLSLATWTLDPALPPPDPRATTITALVTELACTGGKEMGARLQPPSIDYGAEAITIVFSARPLAGGHDCPGNPSTRVLVELREALGDRRLLDGAFFPPADAGASAS